MDKDEVKKWLKENDEGKKLLSELTEGEIEGLKTKNGELIELNKRWKREKEEATTKLQTAQEELEEAKNTDVEAAVKKATDKLNRDLADKDKAINDLQDKNRKSIIDRSLEEALNKANIAKHHIPRVKSFIRTENKIEIDETENVAKIGDKNILAFVTEWAQGEDGKHYVAAAQNSGGGASGSKGANNNGGDVSKLSPKEKLKYAHSNKK